MTDDGVPLDLPTLARQVAAVAEAVGAPQVALVGHSLGAAIATVLAAERPQLIRTLTLAAGFLTAGTNWEGLARQVELDLRVDIHAETNRVACPTLVDRHPHARSP